MIEMLTCPNCNSPHIKSFRDVWSSGTTQGRGSGSGIGADGQVTTVSISTTNQTIEAASCSPPTKKDIWGYFALAIIFVLWAAVSAATFEASFIWVFYAAVLAFLFLLLKVPKVYIQRNMIYPELKRRWDASLKCGQCAREFYSSELTIIIPAANLKDLSVKTALNQNPTVREKFKAYMWVAMALALWAMIFINFIAIVLLIPLLFVYVIYFVRNKSDASSVADASKKSGNVNTVLNNNAIQGQAAVQAGSTGCDVYSELRSMILKREKVIKKDKMELAITGSARLKKYWQLNILMGECMLALDNNALQTKISSNGQAKINFDLRKYKDYPDLNDIYKLMLTQYEYLPFTPDNVLWPAFEQELADMASYRDKIKSLTNYEAIHKAYPSDSSRDVGFFGNTAKEWFAFKAAEEEVLSKRQADRDLSKVGCEYLEEWYSVLESKYKISLIFARINSINDYATGKSKESPENFDLIERRFKGQSGSELMECYYEQIYLLRELYKDLKAETDPDTQRNIQVSIAIKDKEIRVILSSLENLVGQV